MAARFGPKERKIVGTNNMAKGQMWQWRTKIYTRQDIPMVVTDTTV